MFTSFTSLSHFILHTGGEEYNKAKEEYLAERAQANGKKSINAAEAGVATSAVAAAADSSTSADDGPKLRLEWEGMDEKSPKAAMIKLTEGIKNPLGKPIDWGTASGHFGPTASHDQ